MFLKNLIRQTGQSSGLRVDADLTIKINICTLKASIPINEVYVIKLTTEQNF